MSRGFRILALTLSALSLSAAASTNGAGVGAGPERVAAAASSKRLAWALKPGVFERLSPGARQAVLVANGLASAPARPAALTPRVRATAPAASGAPAPRQNVRVNDPALDVDHHESRTTSIAARGALVFVGFEDTTTTASGYGVSSDGGGSFAHMRIEAPSDTFYYGSPSVGIGPAGEIYYAFLLAADGDPTSIALAKSTDGGQTFPVLGDPSGAVENGNDVMDQPAIAVDTTSSRKGTVYVVWTYYSSDYGYTAILCVHSTDGVTFQPSTLPAILSVVDGRIVDHPSVAVAPNGDVYVAYEDQSLSPDGIVITRSTDGGQTFPGLHTVATYQPAGPLAAGGGGAASNPGPSLAVGGNGVVHVAWAAVSSGATSDRSDVFYARSTDNASTFSAARKLNDDGTSTTQAFPAVAALPDGAVGVRWADRRNDAARDTLNDVYMVISRDGGSTWGKSLRVTDTNSEWGPAPHNLAGDGHASYDGLAADGGNFYVSWTDERSGDADVYAAAVPEGFDATAADFDLSALNTYAAAVQGGAATFDLSATGVNGFTGTLALAADLAPAGLTLSLASETATAGQTVRLTVTASASAAPGDYVLGVAASSGGLVRGTRMRLTVMDAARQIAPPANVTRTPGFSTGSVKADSSGVLHSVADDDSQQVTGSDVFYRRSTDGGVTFSTPLRLNASGAFAYESAFAVDATGRIFVAWSGRAPGETSPRIYFARSTDGGATFSAPAAVNAAGGYSVLPSIVADRSGNLVIAWFDVSGTAVVRWSRSTNAGTSFSTPGSISDSLTVFARPGLAIDSKNDVFLAWTQQTFSSASTSVIRLAVSKAGAAFGSAATVTPSTVFAFAPDLATGPDDSVGLAFCALAVTGGTIGTNRQIGFSRSTNGGGAFSNPVLVSSAVDQAYVPAVAFEPSGAIDLAWEEFSYDDVQSDVFAARSTDGGNTFSQPANLSVNGGLSGSSADPVDGIGGNGRAAVSAGANGTLVVSWADDTGGALDLYVSTPRAAVISNHAPVPSIASPAPNATFEAGAPVTFAGSATDADGDTVTLAWTFGDGGSAAGGSPSPHVYAVPGAYAVTLTARDPNGGVGTAALTVNVTVPASSGASTTLFVPVVLEAAGVGGSRYTSDVTLVSRAASPTDVVLAYTASQGSGSGFARVTLAAGEMRVLPGIVDWLRGQGLPIPSDGSTQVGTLRATFGGVSDPSLVWAGARTFTPDPHGGGGTFGLFMQADRVPPAQDPLPGAFVTLAGLQQNASQRSNVAVVNEGGSATVVRVSLQGPSGEDLGTLPDLTLPPGGWYQYNQPLDGKAQAGRALVHYASGDPRFTAYAVLNDAVTSDGSFVPPLGNDGSGADRLVPVVLDVQGLGARFRTELTLTNLTTSPLALQLLYVAASGFGSGSGAVPVTLAPGEQRILPDTIGFLRGTLPIENDGRNVAGSLVVQAPSGTPAGALGVGARTFVPLAPAGSYGLFYPGLTAAQCATGTAFVYGLQENAAQRSNLAVVNRGDAADAITLRITYYGADGSTLGAPVDRTLGPGEWFQFGRPLAALGTSAGYAKVEKLSGASRFAAYAVLNDNVTSDGSYVAMSF
ncbi:MAG TPA: PKD domain-containing protein [Thermoanaerobaculia bacterium]|nr:PKD domain-containing protein [Thermoanaerobaculia bacterium]